MENVGKPILFFCIRNDFCKKYYDNYVHKIRTNVLLVDVDSSNEAKLLQKKFNVESVPTLIVLTQDRENSFMRWSGGTPPDLKRIQMELIMRQAI